MSNLWERRAMGCSLMVAGLGASILIPSAAGRRKLEASLRAQDACAPPQITRLVLYVVDARNYHLVSFVSR
jgi:hypothetical protein